MRHLTWLLILFALSARADVVVTDDSGTTIRLATPARRIVSLAPHITETLYAAGAGSRLVGAVDYSDYPEDAKRLPRVGSYARLDLEAIAGLHPDLIIGWAGGNSAAHIDRLRALGVPLFLIAAQHIDDVASSLERFGQLAGTSDTATAAARGFRDRLTGLRRQYGSRPAVRTFYLIWQPPLMTVGGKQVISDVIRLCGGENIFAALDAMAPTVTQESVLAADPEAIIASGMDEARPEWLDGWRRWQQLSAVRHDNLFFIPPDLIQRHTPRLADGAALLCRHLETARQHLGRQQPAGSGS